MKIAISTESTLDIPKELQKEFDIDVIPFTVILGDKSGFDGDITPPEIFDYVEKTGVLPKTAAVNEYQYDKYFSKLLRTHDAVIHISLSSGISSAERILTSEPLLPSPYLPPESILLIAFDIFSVGILLSALKLAHCIRA